VPNGYREVDARKLRENYVVSTLIDRLAAPPNSAFLHRYWYNVEDAIEFVRRDLQDLLNTKARHGRDVDKYAELSRSVYALGFPDVGSLEAEGSDNAEKIGRIIEIFLTRYEPRLTRVTAVPIKKDKPDARAMHFKINAYYSDAMYGDIDFNTTLELTTGHQKVEK